MRQWQWATSVVIVLLVSCLKAAIPNASESKSAPGSEADKVSMTQDLSIDAKRIVNTIAGAGALRKSVIEKLLEVSLVHSRSAGPELLYYEGEFESGPFSHIEVREPNPSQTRNWLVALTVRDGVALPLSSFRGDPIGPDAAMDIQPRVPPEGLVTYIVKNQVQSIQFGFRGQSKTLQYVGIHRPPS